MEELNIYLDDCAYSFVSQLASHNDMNVGDFCSLALLNYSLMSYFSPRELSSLVSRSISKMEEEDG